MSCADMRRYRRQKTKVWERDIMLCLREFETYYKEERGWTDAFVRAIASMEEQGGGTLVVPAGVYDTFPVELKSNMTLYLEAGAELRFLQDCQGFPVIRQESGDGAQGMYMPCIYARNAENVTVGGSGTLNGQGEYWWKKRRELVHLRPNLVCFERCRRVKVQDLKLINSPFWTVHPLYCDDVEVRGVTICNPWDSPNTDGINPDSCSNVRLLNCVVDVGDDCITLKSGTEAAPSEKACENITIANCNMAHGHGGVVIGSEMSGGVRNVAITNCVFQDTDRGIRVKTRRGRGGAVENVLVSNVIMERVLCPFVFNMYYRCTKNGGEYKDKFAHEVSAGTPAIRNIKIQNCSVIEATAAAAFFYGLPEMPVENVSITDCTLSMREGAEGGQPAMMEDLPDMAQEGIFMRNAKGVIFRNVRVENSKNSHGEGIWNTDDSVEYTVS